MSQAVPIIAALILGGGAIFWMWTRMRTQRNTSAKDYVAEAKARAETELGAYLGSGRRRGK